MEPSVTNRESGKKMNNLLNEIKPEIKESVGELKKATAESIKQTKNTVIRRAREVDGSVRANAWTCIGAAAAVGTVAGYVMGRKGRE